MTRVQTNSDTHTPGTSGREGRSLTHAICLFLFLYFLTRLLTLGALPIFLDEAVHLQWAERLVNEGRVLRPIGSGRVLAVALYALALPFDDRLWIARALATGAGAFTLTCAMTLAHRLFGLRAALETGVLYLISPFALTYDRLALSDGLLSACLTGLMLAVHVLVAKPATAARVAVAALVLLAVLSKVSAVLFLGMVPLALVAFPVDRKKALVDVGLPVLAGLLLASPMLWFFYANSGEIASQHVVDPLAAASVMASTLHDMSQWLVAYFTPALLLAAALALILLRDRRAFWLAGSAALPFVLFAVFSQPWSARYILPTLPPVLILVAGGIDAAASRTVPAMRALIALALVLITSIQAVPFTYRLATAPQDAPFPPDDRIQLVTGWPSGYGVREIAGRLERESRGGDIRVFIDSAGTRTLPTSLGVLLARTSAIHLEEADLGSGAVQATMIRGLANGRVFAVIGPRGGESLDFKAALRDATATRLEVYQRPGGEWAGTLFEIQPSAGSPAN